MFGICEEWQGGRSNGNGSCKLYAVRFTLYELTRECDRGRQRTTECDGMRQNATENVRDYPCDPW